MTHNHPHNQLGETPAASLGAVAQAGFGGFLAELFDLRHETMADFGVVDFSQIFQKCCPK